MYAVHWRDVKPKDPSARIVFFAKSRRVIFGTLNKLQIPANQTPVDCKFQKNSARPHKRVDIIAVVKIKVNNDEDLVALKLVSVRSESGNLVVQSLT